MRKRRDGKWQLFSIVLFVSFRCFSIVSAQLGIAFGSIIGCDFPHDWPDLIAQLVGTK
jgi:hypothetical protein